MGSCPALVEVIDINGHTFECTCDDMKRIYVGLRIMRWCEVGHLLYSSNIWIDSR